jgi:hypothetical protein
LVGGQGFLFRSSFVGGTAVAAPPAGCVPSALGLLGGVKSQDVV